MANETEVAYKEPVHDYFINNMLSSLEGGVTLLDGSVDTIDTDTEVALPGFSFDTALVAEDRAWYEPTLTTPSPTQSYLGVTSWRKYIGYFNVQIYCPLTYGEAKDLCYAEPILNKFKMGTQYTDSKVYITCKSAAVLGSEIDSKLNRWRLSIRIIFQAELKT